MGVAGWKIRAARLAAKDTGVADSTLHLASGRKVRVGHLSLVRAPPLTVVVFDSRDRRVAEFSDLKIGDARRWQELEFRVTGANEEALTLETEIKAGGSCFGSGRYVITRPGLRIELPGSRAVLVTATEPTLRVQVEGQDLDLAEGAEREVRGIRLKREGSFLVVDAR